MTRSDGSWWPSNGRRGAGSAADVGIDPDRGPQLVTAAACLQHLAGTFRTAGEEPAGRDGLDGRIHGQVGRTDEAETRGRVDGR